MDISWKINLLFITLIYMIDRQVDRQMDSKTDSQLDKQTDN